MKRPVTAGGPIGACFLFFSLTLPEAASAQLPVFTLGFEHSPPVFGLPGEVKTVEVFATLTTEQNSSGEGAQGWSIAVGVEDGALREISLKGVVVNTLFDEDGNPATPLIEAPLDLSMAGFRIAHLDSPFQNPQVIRAVSAVYLHLTAFRTLLPEGTARIARLTVEGVIPPGDQCLALTIRHLERSRPFKTGGLFIAAVTLRGETVKPVLGSSTLLFCPPPFFIRCDPNRDGKSDLADAVWILSELFHSGPRSGCPEAADCDADGRRDLTDALYCLAYQFLGGPAPPAPFPACGRVEGVTTSESCPEPPARCPPG